MNMLDLSLYMAEVLLESEGRYETLDRYICLTKLLVMRKVFYIVIAFIMVLFGLFMLMFVPF